MTRDAPVDAQELFADAEGVGVQDAVADVVCERADVGGVVVEPFELEQECSQVLPGGRDGDAERVLDREAERQVVADGGVAGDAFGELGPGAVVAVLEELLDPFVDEPQPCLHGDDRFADDREPEVARARSSPACTGPTGISKTPSPSTSTNGNGLAGLVDRRRRAAVVPEGMPLVGPVLVMHEAAEERVADGDDAEEVGELAFEPAGGKRQRRQARDFGCGAVDARPRSRRVRRCRVGRAGTRRGTRSHRRGRRRARGDSPRGRAPRTARRACRRVTSRVLRRGRVIRSPSGRRRRGGVGAARRVTPTAASTTSADDERPHERCPWSSAREWRRFPTCRAGSVVRGTAMRRWRRAAPRTRPRLPSRGRPRIRRARPRARWRTARTVEGPKARRHRARCNRRVPVAG